MWVGSFYQWMPKLNKIEGGVYQAKKLHIPHALPTKPFYFPLFGYVKIINEFNGILILNTYSNWCMV